MYSAAKRRKTGSPGRKPWSLISRTKQQAAAELQMLPPLRGCYVHGNVHPSTYALGYSLAPLRGFGQHALG